MDLHDFADPWEHVRMLADGRRNGAIEALLKRWAPGARVLEVGAGTGVWSLVAARCGAKHVVAVEPTATATLIEELIVDNQLTDRVEVIQATVEELEPRPVDLAFAELLNVDPYAEGMREALAAARRWIVPGGLLAPRTLRLWVQALDAPESARERDGARATTERLAAAHGLKLGALDAFLEPAESYRYAVAAPRLRGAPVEAFAGEPTADLEVELALEVGGDAPVTGVALWWEAELDEGIVWSNAPGSEGAWDRLAITWPVAATPRGGRLTVHLSAEDDAIEVCPRP